MNYANDLIQAILALLKVSSLVVRKSLCTLVNQSDLFFFLTPNLMPYFLAWLIDSCSFFCTNARHIHAMLKMCCQLVPCVELYPAFSEFWTLTLIMKLMLEKGLQFSLLRCYKVLDS